MPHAWKKYVFLFLVLDGLVLAALRAWLPAAGAALALAGWLAWETRERGRFSFIAGRRAPESIAALPGDSKGLAVSRTAPWALVVNEGPVVSRLGLEDGRLGWTRGFDETPLALTLRPDGRLLWASGEALHLSDADGADVAALPFEPPLYRQSYKLLLSADGRAACLHTPWFIQAFDPDLGALGPRLRYEDAGHYMKYAALSPDGARLYTAGALLLDDEESGGAAMEARWDAWDRVGGAWVNAWRRANESYNNSHLRGLSLSDDGRLLCADVWQEGYGFRLHDPAGALLWKRNADAPVLSPRGEVIAWHSPLEGLLLFRTGDQARLYALKLEEKIRFKQPLDDGRCLVVAGRRVLSLDAGGRVTWEAFLRTDPEDFALGAGGRLVCVHGDRVGVLKLPWPA